MREPYETYAPQNAGEVLDFLAMMLLSAPTFEDETNHFPERNIDTVFAALLKGLKAARAEIGDHHYRALVEIAAEMREHFEADPRDENGRTAQGCRLLLEMENITKDALRKRPE